MPKTAFVTGKEVDQVVAPALRYEPSARRIWDHPQALCEVVGRGVLLALCEVVYEVVGHGVLLAVVGRGDLLALC